MDEQERYEKLETVMVELKDKSDRAEVLCQGGSLYLCRLFKLNYFKTNLRGLKLTCVG